MKTPSWQFVVEAPLWGYKQGRREAYKPERVAYKTRVRLAANREGIPDDLGRDDEAWVAVTVNWKRRGRIDGKNILALIEDSIFHRDRRILHGRYDVIENTGKESVLVVVKIRT